MPTGTRGQASIEIHAPAQDIYHLVSDVSRIAKVMERVRLVPGVTGLSVARGPGGAGGRS
jgi:hypothetical protein